MKKFLFVIASVFLGATIASAQIPVKSNSVAAAASNNLSQKIFVELAEKDKGKNVFFSPYSIFSALNLAYAGANGETKKEFETLYGVDGKDDLHLAYKTMHETLKSSSGPNEVLNANALWISDNADILPNYSSTARDFYNTEETKVDFTKSQHAADTINSWVAKNTKNKITQIVSPDLFDASTRLVITNAIYFFSKWAQPFEKEWTMEKDFMLLDGKTKKAQLMSSGGKYRKYLLSDNSQIVEMDYKDGQLSMLVFLPKGKDQASLDKVLKSLDKEISEFDTKAEKKKIQQLVLPKFKFETETLSIGEILQKLGLKSAFSENADFSNISGKEKLFISKALHKAVVEVNEDGTEAAAATAISIATTSMPMPEPVIIEFIADRPFIFVIREKQTGLILFAGQITDPTN